jgi:inorganic triphosphatase YgiF
MSTETELKLRISPEHMTMLRRHALLKQHATSRLTTRNLHNVYFDTPELDLRSSRMALRLRRTGNSWVQTLKGGGSAHGGLHVRNEWETAVPDKRLNVEELVAVGAPGLKRELMDRLQPIFTTDFERTICNVVYERSEIELAMDVGEITSGIARCPISEVELELKSGDPAALFKLALALIEIVPLAVEVTSKAEHGYLLYTRSAPRAVKAADVSFDEGADISSALRTLIWSCLHQLTANIDGAIAQVDDEFLHQLRVGMRRLRVVLSMALTRQDSEELASSLDQISALSVDLGRLREWDVFIRQISEPLAQHLAEQEIDAFMDVVEQHRATYRRSVRQSLQSLDLEKVLLRLGAWTHGDAWRYMTGSQSLRGYVETVLTERLHKVLKRGRGIAIATPEELHRLRIACKKLRYSLELFQPVLNTNEAERQLKYLNRLQDSLGYLNDIAVGYTLLDELDRESPKQSIYRIYTLMLRSWFKQERQKEIANLVGVWDLYSKNQTLSSRLV